MNNTLRCEIIDWIRTAFTEMFISKTLKLDKGGLGHNFNSSFRTRLNDSALNDDILSAITLLLKYGDYSHHTRIDGFNNWLDQMKDKNLVPYFSSFTANKDLTWNLYYQIIKI